MSDRAVIRHVRTRVCDRGHLAWRQGSRTRTDKSVRSTRSSLLLGAPHSGRQIETRLATLLEAFSGHRPFRIGGTLGTFSAESQNTSVPFSLSGAWIHSRISCFVPWIGRVLGLREGEAISINGMESCPGYPRTGDLRRSPVSSIVHRRLVGGCLQF